MRPVLLGHGGVVLAELLADRVHLLAQEVLALLLLRARLDVVADALAHLQLGQPVALQAQRQLEPLDDVERLQQLDLLLEVQVGRVARRVGQRARIGDRAHERADAAVVAAQLEDLLDHGAVLALELAGAGRRRRLVGALVDLDPQAALGVGGGGAGDAAVQAGEGDGVDAARQPHVLADLGHQADVGVLGAVPRDEQNAGLVADVHRQGDIHAGEDDGVLEWDQEKFRHEGILPEIVEVGKYPLPWIMIGRQMTECWELLFDLLMAERARMPTIAAEFDLSPTQVHVLRLLEPGTTVPMGRLACGLGCDASNITGVIDRLEARGLVERRAGERDRRVKVLVVTERGLELRRRLLSRISEPPEPIARLSPADQRALSAILRRALDQPSSTPRTSRIS